jgi:hypothetical protein
MIFDYQLFLGFPLSDIYLSQLSQLSPELCSVFIKNHSDYLHQVEIEGKIYLGKYLGPFVDFSSLELIQNNIYSLLKRLIANYPYESYPLVLLAVKG